MIVKIPQTAAALPVRGRGFGVITPFLFTGVHVERQYFAVGRTDVERVTDLQRRVLVFCTGAIALRDIPGMGDPGDFQLVDVLLVDLIKGRKTIPVSGVTPGFEV